MGTLLYRSVTESSGEVRTGNPGSVVLLGCLPEIALHLLYLITERGAGDILLVHSGRSLLNCTCNTKHVQKARTSGCERFCGGFGVASWAG